MNFILSFIHSFTIHSFLLQVLLAVDDSRSMAECGCGGLALEALTLLCRAMSRLEVGVRLSAC